LCNGSATATRTGGTFPFTYSWSTGPASSSISALCAGNYTVTVSDSAHCQKLVTALISQPANPCANFNATVSVVNASAFGSCNGSATATRTGGTFPFTYSWNTGPTTSSISALCAGSYTVTVTDSNNCQKAVIASITQPANPCTNFGVTVSVINAATSANCNGSATSAVSGGKFPYTYSWNSGPVTASINNLCVGSYTLTAKDSNACVKTVVATIAADSIPNPCVGFGVSISHVNASTSTSCNGTASSAVSGGKAPYKYLWSNGPVSSSVLGLCVGNYSLTVTDSNSCNKTVSTNISIDSTCTGFAVNITGGGTIQTCVGQASAHTSGGTAPFIYNWSNFFNTAAISNLCPGTYKVTVRDAKGCGATSSVIFLPDTTVAPIPLNMFISTTDATSPTNCDGTSALTVTGGKGPFVYAYSNGSTAATANSLCPGFYNVMVTDHNGAKDSIHFVIASQAAVFSDTTHHSFPDSVVVATIQTNAVPNCNINFAAVDSVNIASYSQFTTDSIAVTWNVYSGGSFTPVVNKYGVNASGVYTLIFQIYCSGHTAKTSGTVGFLKAVAQLNVHPIITGIGQYNTDPTHVYPVPFSDQLTVQWNENGPHLIVVFDLLGKQVTEVIQLYDSGIHTLNLSGLTPGCYLMKIRSANGDEFIKIMKN